MSARVSTRALVDGFRAIVGAAHASDDKAVREAAAVDGVVPRVIVAPASTDDVARAVALAAAEGCAVVPRGSGSALAQGRPPARADVVLDLTRLGRVLEYNPDDLTVTAEAGVTAGTLAALLGERRQFLPVDPPGVARRTLGGLTATNAHGPLRARYGTLRDLLLGVRFVQADGVATWGGSKVVKSVTGYDVPKLMVGALGTLGVLTELTLRLHARPDVERTALVVLPATGTVQTLVDRILDSPLQPSRLEALDAVTLAALGVTGGSGVAVTFGSVDAAVTAQEAQVTALAHAAGGTMTAAPALWPAYERLWQPDPHVTLLTIGSLPARVGATLEAVAQARDSLRGAARVLAAACAVVGGVRVSVSGAGDEATAGAIERLRAAVAAWGGTVMIQAAPRAVRAAVDPWGSVPPDTLAVMRAIKTTFDPDGRLNPGRFVAGL